MAGRWLMTGPACDSAIASLRSQSQRVSTIFDERLSSDFLHPTSLDTDTIRARLAAMLPELRERYGVRSLAIFGSYARGEQTPGSDIDLVVEFEELPDLYGFVGLGLDLEEALGMKVDVGTREMLKKRVARTALRDLVPV